MPKIFRGAFALSCTPFDAEGVQGIIPTGSTGEFAFLSLEERCRVVETALDEVKESTGQMQRVHEIQAG